MEDTNRFRVLIDAKKIDDGGIGSYLKILIEGFLENGNIDVTLLSSKEKIIKYDWRNEVTLIEDDTKPYSIKESFSLKNKVDCSKFDIFHVPHYTLPFGINIPTIATIHDIIHITNPRKIYYPFISRPWIGSTLKRASKIITVSESSKKDLIQNFSYAKKNQNKIVVIPNAPSLEISNESKSLNFNYFVAIFSNTMPHKGLEDLLWAYSKLEEKFIDYNLPKLLLVGFGIEELLKSEWIKKQKLSPNVKLLGAVSKEKLSNLVHGAEALVIPSLAEGFCIQALDAQILKVPVISRPVPAVCEILSRNDFCAKSMSKEDFYETMKLFFQLSLERNFIYTVDEQHLKKYKKENIISLTLDLYSQVTGKNIKKEKRELQKAV